MYTHTNMQEIQELRSQLQILKEGRWRGIYIYICMYICIYIYTHIQEIEDLRAQLQILKERQWQVKEDRKEKCACMCVWGGSNKEGKEEGWGKEEREKKSGRGIERAREHMVERAREVDGGATREVTEVQERKIGVVGAKKWLVAPTQIGGDYVGAEEEWREGEEGRVKRGKVEDGAQRERECNAQEMEREGGGKKEKEKEKGREREREIERERDRGKEREGCGGARRKRTHNITRESTA